MDQQGLYHQIGQTPTPSAPTPTPEDEKRANILCIISLACELLPILVNTIFSLFSSTLKEVAEVDVQSAVTFSDILMNVWGTVCVALMIAGLAIMIYVRVRYPQNVFGKVLMWVYIIVGVISIIIFIVYILFIIWACVSCMSCITGLG